MNIVQIREKIAFRNDRTASSRFEDFQYDEAIQSAVQQILRNRFDNIKDPGKYSFEMVQRIIDELRPLVIVSAPIIPVGNIIQATSFPANYREFLLAQVTISGIQYWTKPMYHAQVPVLNSNPFKKASVSKDRVYQLFDSRGLEVLFDTGTLTSAIITYIKEPAIPTLGIPSSKIGPGLAVLSIGVSYYVLNDCIVGTTAFSVGTQFTATSTNLVSGLVVAVSNTVNTDLPVQLHDEICAIASSLMMGTIEDYNKVNMTDAEIVKN